MKDSVPTFFQDDIAMVIGLLCILLLTVTVVVVKVTMIDPKVDTNISTFKPLAQQINSNSKYTDVGYIPCNGYVPCMVSYYLSITINQSAIKSRNITMH